MHHKDMLHKKEANVEQETLTGKLSQRPSLGFCANPQRRDLRVCSIGSGPSVCFSFGATEDCLAKLHSLETVMSI